MFKKMSKMLALMKVLELGQEVGDPRKWKHNQIYIGKISALIASILVLLKYFFPDMVVSEGFADSAAVAVIGLASFINMVLTIITSKKVGRKPKNEIPRQDSGADSTHT